MSATWSGRHSACHSFSYICEKGTGPPSLSWLRTLWQTAWTVASDVCHATQGAAGPLLEAAVVPSAPRLLQVIRTSHSRFARATARVWHSEYLPSSSLCVPHPKVSMLLLVFCSGASGIRIRTKFENSEGELKENWDRAMVNLYEWYCIMDNACAQPDIVRNTAFACKVIQILPGNSNI